MWEKLSIETPLITLSAEGGTATVLLFVIILILASWHVGKGIYRLIQEAYGQDN